MKEPLNYQRLFFMKAISTRCQFAQNKRHYFTIKSPRKVALALLFPLNTLFIS
jgi:hypothetical protein